jgi:E3 ubiquitin-protein ligase BRE1
MKRALAERAKQSGLPNGSGPSEPEAGEPVVQPDLDNGGDSNVPLTANTTSGTSVRHKKRLRESVIKLEEEDEDDSNANAFYLRHQNRALASELRQMKYQLTRLEHEREIRRVQCTRALQNLNALHATWSQLEEALKCRQSSCTDAEKLTEGPSSAPLSTGSGSSVELVGALFNALAALGSNGIPRIKSDVDMDVDDSDEDDLQLPEPLAIGEEDEEDDPGYQEELAALMGITSNISKRANTLQGWILALLHRIENGATAASSGLSDQVHAAQQQVARLRAKNKTLKAQIQELARSRDELQESDKRVRRGLYRLASNRVQLKEVLKAIVSCDEDKDAATEWMEFGGGHAISTTNAAPASAMVKSEDSGVKQSPVSSEEVARLQKKILDLEQVASSRDDQIKMVSLQLQIPKNMLLGFNLTPSDSL